MTGSELRYWLLLHSIEGIGAVTFHKLLNRFGSPEDVFSTSKEELLKIPRLNKKISEAILKKKEDVETIDQLLEQLEEKEIKILTIQDEGYPPLLSKIENPPPLLYVYGELRIEKSIGIVGARRASDDALKAATQFARELSKDEFTIVSGYAKGIDTAAHLGAILERGNTVAVLSCGILKFSLHRELQKVREELERQAVVISEFFPAAEWTVGQAMARNRTISGLSEAILVIEAGERGGTINTAQMAKKQGKPLFIYAPTKSEGDKKIVEMGGILIESVKDILAYLVNL